MPCANPAKVALCVFATGRYLDFVPDLVATARKHFRPSEATSIVVLTNGLVTDTQVDLVLSVPRLPWPLGTLLRYHFLATHHHDLVYYDYLFMCDADMFFVGDVGPEILGKRVATLGQMNLTMTPKDLTFCRVATSTAYIPKGCGDHYYIGGFQGGETATYLADCKILAEMINTDLSNNLIPEWHDESYWNAHLVQNAPTITLPPGFCANEHHPIDTTKIACIVKDHDAFRKWD